MTDFSTETRKKLAREGKAMKDGSYPTPTLASLSDAIQAWGRSNPSDRPTLKRYLQRRATALGASKAMKDRISQLKV